MREQVTFDDDDVRFLFQLMLVHLCNVKMVGIVQSTFLDKLCVLVRQDLEVNFVNVCICKTNIIQINYFTHISMIVKIKMRQRVWVYSFFNNNQLFHEGYFHWRRKTGIP